MQVIVNDTLINYTDVGQGTVLICLHGWMDSKAAYGPLEKDLQKDCRIVALDLPNFGASQITDNIVTINDYAHFLAAFVSKLNLKDYILVGHSMGCQIALYGVGEGILHPEKLILLAPAGVRNKHNLLKKLLRYASVMAKPVLPSSVKRRFYKRIGSDYDPNFSKVHKAVIENSLTTDVQAQAAQISLATLLINGDHDTSTPLWMAKILNQKIKGSTLEIIKGGDHWIQQKHPEVIGKILRTFI